jgi:hypothetical protein
MSKLRSSYSQFVASQTADGPMTASLREEYPSLVEAFTGIRDDAGNWEVWPCTVMMFLEGDVLKFCLNPKSGNRVAFGSVSDASKGFSGIDQALRDGNFEWKPRGHRNRS